MKRNIRLKGVIYANHFQALAQRPHIIDDLQQEYDRKSYSREYQDLMTWRKGMKMKKDYHEKLYGNIKQLEPLKVDSELTLSNYQNKSNTEKIEMKIDSPQYSYIPRL